MTNRRPILIAAVVAALALAGCGSGTADNPSTGDPVDAGASSSTAAADTGAGSAPGTPAGESDSAGDYDPTAIFRWGIPGPPTSFDLRKSAPLDPQFLDPVYEALIKRAPSGDLEPGLATEWEFSDDATELTMTLRDGVTFHDGETFNADAVVISLKAWAETGAQSSPLSSVKDVKAVDDQHVTISFDEPAGYMLTILAGEPGMIVSPKAIDNPDLGTTPVGTGPYTLTKLDQGSVTYRKFDDYWNPDAVHNGGIDMTIFSDEPTRLRALISGEIDGTSIGASQVEQARSSGLTILQGPSTTFPAILLNTSDPNLAKPEVRQALSYAIDRVAIGESLFAGACVPSVQPFQEGFAQNNPDLNDVTAYYDVEKAKQLLAEAGVPDGFKFELMHGPNTTYQNLAQVLQAQLSKIGLDVSVKQMDFSQTLEARRTGKFQGAVQLAQPGRPDATQFIVSFYTPGGAYNSGNFELPGLSDKLAAARASSDEADRTAKVQEIIADVQAAGPPVIPICGITWSGAFGKNVSGLEVPSSGDYYFGSVKIGK